KKLQKFSFCLPFPQKNIKQKKRYIAASFFVCLE
ncbi:hypothetical protein KKC_09922, partial [Listeria fleischmannii subsp. coloradonensis]